VEKRADIKPGRTPDTEGKLRGEKTAAPKQATRELDDDFTHRAADAAAAKLKPKSGS